MLRACLAWRCVSWGVEGQERAVEVDGHTWRLDMGWLNFRGLYVARFCGGRRICASRRQRGQPCNSLSQQQHSQCKMRLWHDGCRVELGAW